jgi:hypothetical protein
MEALELLQSLSHAIRQVCPEKLSTVREMLAAFETKGPWENTVWLETLAAYDGLELEVTADDALAEMRGLIAPDAEDRAIDSATLSGVTPRQFLGALAQGALGRIFEDVFQGAYFEAYFLLSADEKHRILCLAGEAETGFLTDWILGELLSHDGPTALPVYARFAAGIDTTNPFQQDAVACFAMAIVGYARWSETPPAYSKGDSLAHRAWHLVGEILFWRARGGRSTASDRQVKTLWQRFEGSVLLAAADVLFRLRRTGYRPRGVGYEATDLVRDFPTEIRPIFQACLDRRDSLPSIFPTFAGSNRDVIRFLITTLGEMPDSSSVPLLRELVEDPDFGSDAIAALEAIQQATLGAEAHPDDAP